MNSASKNSSIVNHKDKLYPEKSAFQRGKTANLFSRKTSQKTQPRRPQTASSILPPLGPSRAKSAPASPLLQRRPFLSKTSSLTSLEMQNDLKRNRFLAETPRVERSPLVRRNVRTEVMSDRSLTEALGKHYIEDARKRQTNAYGVEISTPPLSPALRRKLLNTECLMKGARIQIHDYRHESPTLSPRSERSAVDPDALAKALEEVKNCRYLRIVDSNSE